MAYTDIRGSSRLNKPLTDKEINAHHAALGTVRDLLAEEGAKHSFRFQRIALKLYGGKPATPQDLPPELVVVTPLGRPVASISVGRAAMWIVSYKHPGVGYAAAVDREWVAPAERPDHLVEFVLSLLGAAAEIEVA